MYDTGVALTGLSCFVTPDLARDLANDIMTLVSHRASFAFSERTVLSCIEVCTLVLTTDVPH